MDKQTKKKIVLFILGGLVAVGLVMGVRTYKNNQTIYVTYQYFLKMLEASKIKMVMLYEDDHIVFQCLNDATHYETDHPATENFKEQLLIHNVKVREAVHVSDVALVQSILGFMMFGGMFYIISKSIRGKSGGRQMSMQVEQVDSSTIQVGFSDIAGNVEAKEQMRDIISFIQTPEKYAALGAKMPKGVMLYGPPGTGKTLMAKAIAKEAGVPFFHASGSDFVQLYVGVGASRIRELFEKAKQHEKAVVFIDEIDAIGKKRSMSPTNSNDEKDQTLNALLTEMSGFSEKEGIVVIGATNRLELLDGALLRPGRFDRHIEIGYPDPEARKQIIKLYLKDKPIDESICVDSLTKQTTYFTGAMLNHLINEAAIIAGNEQSKTITMQHIDQAFYEVVAGKEKKDRSHITEVERKITAYHEAGHALVTKLVAPENSVSKVTIIPSTKGAGGFSMNIPKDKMYHTKKDILAQIQVCLAGRVAEMMIFGEDGMTTGASNDIEKATQYVKDYVMKYGMHKDIGCVNLEVLSNNENVIQEKFFETCQEIIQEMYEKTKCLIEEQEERLHRLANQLLKQETLNETDIDRLMKL